MVQELARHSKLKLTANIYTHLSIKDTAADVEKLGAIPTGERGQQNRRAIPGYVKIGIWGISGHKPSLDVLAESGSEHGKALEKTGFPGVIERVTDGTRTSNFWNHNPTDDTDLNNEKPTENIQ